MNILKSWKIEQSQCPGCFQGRMVQKLGRSSVWCRNSPLLENPVLSLRSPSAPHLLCVNRENNRINRRFRFGVDWDWKRARFCEYCFP